MRQHTIDQLINHFLINDQAQGWCREVLLCPLKSRIQESSPPSSLYPRFTSVKLSNNALNFLLAQYRAIFKRAYVKGIASAVILTAGLAATQAQAAPLSGAASWDTVSGTTIASGTYESIDTTNRFFNDLNITSGSVTITKASGKHNTAVNVKGQLTVKSGATLTVSNGALAGAYTESSSNQTNITDKTKNTGSLVVESGGNFVLNNGKWVQMNHIEFQSGSQATLSGTAATNWDSIDMVYGHSVLVAKGAKIDLTDAQLSTFSNGILQINGKVTLNSGSLLRATDALDENGDVIEGQTAGKIVFGDGAEINAAENSKAAIIGQDIQINSGAKVTVASGGNLTLGGDFNKKQIGLNDTKTQSSDIVLNGEITIESGADFSLGKSDNEKTTTTLTIENGTLTNNSAKTQVDGNIVVEATGTIKGSGTYVLQDDGGLTMSSEKMKAYVAQGGKVDASTNDGATLTFTDSTSVDLSDLTIFGADKIKIGANTVLAGDNVTVTGKIEGVTGYVGAIKKDDLVLGGNDYTGDLNLAKAIAHNTMELQGQNDIFTVSGTALTLDRPYYVIDETTGEQVLDSCGLPIENTVGRVTGDKIVLAEDTTAGASGTASLQAISGRWVVDNDIEVSGGSILVTAANSSSPAYLELQGDLTLSAAASASSFFAKVNGTKGDSTLDLSNVGELSIQNGQAKHVNLNATNGGVLVMTGTQIEDKIIGDTANKVSLKIESGSTLRVVDDLDLDFGDIVTNAAVNKIRLEGTDPNTVDVLGTLTLTTGTEGNSTTAGTQGTPLNIGNNKLQANALVLENQYSADNGKGTFVQDANVAVQSGHLIALSSLTVVNDNLLLGSGTSADASLTLGDSTLAYPYNATGTVNADNITAESGSDINVYGNWTQAGKLTINSGNLSVNGSYQGTELALGANGSGTFAGVEDGTASSFTRVSASATNSLNVESGTLRIEGEVVPGQGSAANTTNPYGVALANGAVKVADGATLAFGNVASDNAFEVANNTVTMNTGFGTINLAGGTVALDFQNEFQSGINAATLVSLKKTWLNGSGDNGALNGWLDIGDTNISDLATILKPSKDGTYYTATQAQYAPIVDVLASVKNEQVKNLLLTEVKDEVKGVYGALQTTANTKNITFSDDTILSNASINGGNFATVGTTSELASFNVTGAELNLDSTKGTGVAGAIALDSTSTLLLTGDNAITIGEISGTGYVSAHTDTVVNGGVKGTALNTYADVLVAGNVDVTGGISNYTEGVTGGTLEASDGNGTYYNVDADGFVDFEGGYLKAKDVTLGSGGEFIQDAVLTATGKLTLGGDLYLGQAAEEAACPNADDIVGSAGFMDAYELDLSGHDIFLDPDYDQHASVGATQYFKGRIQSNEFDGGTVDGDIYIGQNAAFGIGATLAETQAALERLKLTDSNGALTNGTGSVLYVNRGFTVEEGYKLVLDSTATRSELQSTQHEANKAANGYSGYIEAESGIIMTDNAFGADMTGTAITFKDDAATIFAEDGAKIILSGQRFTTNQELNLLNDDGNNGVDIVGAEGDGTISVQTENGLLIGSLSGSNAGMGVNLTVNLNARSILSGASDPIYQAIVQYAQGDLDGDATTTDDAVVGEGYTPESIAAYEASNPRDPSLLVRNPADNALLTATVNTGNGHAAESAARLALYGGAVQAALTSSKSTSDAIATRMGIGSQAAELTAADNGVGGGLWVAPIYVNSDSDGFEAQGVSYGTDLNLYGVSLGADYAFLPNLRAGIMFNVGSGDADGQGIASNVTNDFDYWGLGIYAGYTYGAFTVVGDFGYSTVDNDVKAGSGLAEIGELSSSMDAAIYTVGVTAQYGLEFSGIDIKPHAGLRYSFVDLDDYSVDSSVAGEVAGYDADSMSVFSIPVGVTFSKDIVSENWTVKPSFDLTLTGNFGDDEAEGTVGWTGVANLDKSLTTEVFDNFTYGATLGISAQNTSGFALGVNVGYTGSSNVDDLSVGANARFTF